MSAVHNQLNESELRRLMIEAVNGDSNAYNQLLQKLSFFLNKWFQSKNVTLRLNDDLIQETLIAVHKSRHTFDENREFVSWFLAIAHYKYSDYLRTYYKNRNNVEITESMLESEGLNKFIQSDYNFEDDILPYLNVLTESQKKLLIYAKVDGLSIKAISQLENVTESVVKVTIHRAVHKLKEVIGRSYDSKK